MGWQRAGEAASLGITHNKALRTPTLGAFQVVFIENFCECEDVAFARAYSAATSIRWDEQTSSEASSRIIPQTVSQHFPQFIVVEWCL